MWRGGGGLMVVEGVGVGLVGGGWAGLAGWLTGCGWLAGRLAGCGWLAGWRASWAG